MSTPVTLNIHSTQGNPLIYSTSPLTLTEGSCIPVRSTQGALQDHENSWCTLMASQEVTSQTHQQVHIQALRMGRSFSSQTSLDPEIARTLESPPHFDSIPRPEFQPSTSHMEQGYALSAMTDLHLKYNSSSDQIISLFKQATLLSGKVQLEKSDLIDYGLDPDNALP
jgi:hypothetical protein